MNILFHIDVECVPENGGIERVTSLLTKELRKRGHKVYSSYTIPVEREAPRPDFDGVYRLARFETDSLRKIISENEIDVIVVQKMFRDLPWFKKAIQESGRNTKLVYAMHTRPSGLSGSLGFRSLVFNDKSKLSWIKIPLKAILHPYRRKQYIYQQYTWPSIYADETVLLSHQYIDIWRELSKNKNERLDAIGNPLTFDNFATKEDLSEKDKKVLIVARIAENEKNLTEALRIWKQIERNPSSSDWSLDIVGDGPDRDKVEKEAKSLELKRVTFWGYRSPLSFYKQSSIFMMTSRFEGWGMTITEAQQYGCVPLGYSTFSAITELIQDGKNGFLIQPYHTEEYAKKMLLLMHEKELRNEMALCGIKTSSRFQTGPTVDKWESLFNKLLSDEK